MKSYDWTRDEMFVIYPKCFSKRVNFANFKLEFEDDVSEKLGIRLTELYCDGRKAKEIILSNFDEPKIVNDRDKRKTVYIADNIKINTSNVYIITISAPNNYSDELRLFPLYIQGCKDIGYVSPDDNSVFRENVIVDKQLWNKILQYNDVKNIINNYNKE